MTGMRYSQLCPCPRAPCRPTPCSRLHDRRASTEGGGLHPQQVPSWSPAMPSTPVRSVATSPPAARRGPWLAGAPLRASLGSSHDGLDRLKHTRRAATAAATVTMACPAPWDNWEAVTRERPLSSSPSPSPSPISDQSPPQLFPKLYLTLMRS
jgi:hypothetical protein